MTCDRWRLLISAEIDGELDPPDDEHLAAHLQGCVSCRVHHERAWDLRRRFALSPVADGPADDGDHPTVFAQRQARPVDDLMRWLLLVIGGALVVLHARDLFGLGVEDPTADTAHLTRHAAVFGLALGIGLIGVWARPERAIGLLGFTTVVGALLIATAVIDLVTGRASIAGEAVHVVELIGVLCLWWVSGGPNRVQRLVTGPRSATLFRWRTST